MGKALEVIGARVTNPSTTITAYTPNTGDSFTVRNFAPGSQAFCLRTWGLGATAGIQQIHSPRWHDNVRGFRAKLLAADSRPVWNLGRKQTLQPQDVLVFEASGGGSETDTGAMLNYYVDLPGADARLIDMNQLNQRAVNVLTVETTHTSSATAGDWGGSVAINSGSQLLKANTDYAIVGYITDTNLCSVGYRGPDTGNIRAGGSGSNIRTVTREWFTDLTEQTGMPCIPVFNAANAGGTFVDIAVPATGSTVVIETLLIQLTM